MLGEYSSNAVKADHTAMVGGVVAAHRWPQQCVWSKIIFAQDGRSWQRWVVKIMAKTFAQDGIETELLASRHLMLEEIFAEQRRPQCTVE